MWVCTNPCLPFLSVCLYYCCILGQWTKCLLSIVSSHGLAFLVYAMLFSPLLDVFQSLAEVSCSGSSHSSPSFDSINFNSLYGFLVFPFFYLAKTLVWDPQGTVLLEKGEKNKKKQHSLLNVRDSRKGRKISQLSVHQCKGNVIIKKDWECLKKISSRKLVLYKWRTNAYFSVIVC